MGYLVDPSGLVYTHGVKRRGLRDKGYLVVVGLLVVACAMVFSTATLAAMRAKQKESIWAQSRTQEMAVARSVTAVLVNNFNVVGDVSNLGVPVNGTLFSVPYTATLTQDTAHPEVYRLQATVGESTYTRVVQERPRLNHSAYSRNLDLSTLQSDLFHQDSVGGAWTQLSEPPTQPGETEYTVATAANFNDNFFIYRVGERRALSPRTAYLSQYDSQADSWTNLPPVPYSPAASWRTSSSFDVASLNSQSLVSASDDRLYVVIGPNRLYNSSAPSDIAEMFWYDLETRPSTWNRVPLPDPEVYDDNGRPRREPDVYLNRIALSEHNFLLEASASSTSRVSTIFQISNGGWRRLPPIPVSSTQFGRPYAMAAGPGGKVSLVTKDPNSGDYRIQRLEDGLWVSEAAPGGAGVRVNLVIDAQGKEWFQDLSNGKMYQGTNGSWQEEQLPAGHNAEVEVGAKPDNALHYYQTTAGY